MLETQIFELGNSLGFITGQVTLEDLRSGKVATGNGKEPGEKLLKCYKKGGQQNSILVGKDEQRRLAIFGLLVGLLFGLFVGFGDYWKRHRSSAIGSRDSRLV